MGDVYTVCPRSSNPFCVVTYYIKWVTTSWTHSIYTKKLQFASYLQFVHVCFNILVFV